MHTLIEVACLLSCLHFPKRRQQNIRSSYKLSNIKHSYLAWNVISVLVRTILFRIVYHLTKNCSKTCLPRGLNWMRSNWQLVTFTEIEAPKNDTLWCRQLIQEQHFETLPTVMQTWHYISLIWKLFNYGRRRNQRLERYHETTWRFKMHLVFCWQRTLKWKRKHKSKCQDYSVLN